MPALMTEANQKEAAVSRAVVDLAEAVVLGSRIGDVLDAEVVALEGSGVRRCRSWSRRCGPGCRSSLPLGTSVRVQGGRRRSGGAQGGPGSGPVFVGWVTWPALFLDDAVPERVLAVTAHPDDVDFGMAGTIARWTDGRRVGVVLHRHRRRCRRLRPVGARARRSAGSGGPSRRRRPRRSA